MAVLINLDKLLSDRGMTQVELSSRTGLSRNTISKLANQPAQLRLETLDLLCDALDVNPGDIFVRVKIEQM